jgi:low affinity Fe/Cu permease
MSRQISKKFASLASWLSKWMGSPWALIVVALLVAIGLLVFGVDKTNIAISIGTLLMVFILQNSQNHGMTSRASSRSLMRRSTNSTKKLRRGRIARDGMYDDSLRALVETLDRKARDDLRRVLIRDQAQRRRDRLTLDALPRRVNRGLGRHHRHADAASGGAAEGR